MTEMICIVCPKGCLLTVDEEHGCAVSGAGCERGEEYGRTELQNPTRVLTSTVKLRGGALRRCPVRTSGAIPKALLFEAMEVVNAVTLTAPVKTGQVAVKNLLGTGCDLIVTRDID